MDLFHFEAWLRGHPGHAGELRALQADWGSFDDLLGMALGRAGSRRERWSQRPACTSAATA